mgnify:CR=1 FL=1
MSLVTPTETSPHREPAPSAAQRDAYHTQQQQQPPPPPAAAGCIPKTTAPPRERTCTRTASATGSASNLNVQQPQQQAATCSPPPTPPPPPTHPTTTHPHTPPPPPPHAPAREPLHPQACTPSDRRRQGWHAPPPTAAAPPASCPRPRRCAARCACLQDRGERRRRGARRWVGEPCRPWCCSAAQQRTSSREWAAPSAPSHPLHDTVPGPSRCGALTVVSGIHCHARQQEAAQQRQVAVEHRSAQHSSLLHAAFVAVQAGVRLQGNTQRQVAKSGGGGWEGG